MAIKRIAVIGLGMMGTPISALLLKAGYAVTGYDVVKTQMTDLVPQGMKPAASPKQAVKDAEVVILSLANWKILRRWSRERPAYWRGSGRARSSPT